MVGEGRIKRTRPSYGPQLTTNKVNRTERVQKQIKGELSRRDGMRERLENKHQGRGEGESARQWAKKGHGAEDVAVLSFGNKTWPPTQKNYAGVSTVGLPGSSKSPRVGDGHLRSVTGWRFAGPCDGWFVRPPEWGVGGLVAAHACGCIYAVHTCLQTQVRYVQYMRIYAFGHPVEPDLRLDGGGTLPVWCQDNI